MIADTLTASGYNVVAVPVEQVDLADRFDAAIVGAALYSTCGHRKRVGSSDGSPICVLHRHSELVATA
jgi:menaquinone-dependent protoporphyrinogen IX oxidase